MQGVPLPNGKTALRVDTQVVWLVSRPASEQVPGGVSSVTVVFKQPDNGTGTSSSNTVEVTDPTQVSQIVSLTDALPAAQPGVTSCPADLGSGADVTFNASDGAPLAEADAASGGCGGVSFSIGGQRQNELTGGYTYVNDLKALLGTN